MIEIDYLIYDIEISRVIRQQFASAVGYPDAVANCHPEILAEHAGDHMEGHIGLN